MRRFLDGELVADRSRPADAPPELWPCDDGYRFFLIMNLAVGRWFDEPHEPLDTMQAQRLLVA